MKTSKRLLRALLAAALCTAPAVADEWTTAMSGGSIIDVPMFFTEGPMRALMMNGEDFGTAYEPMEEHISLRQYRTKATGRPYVYLAKSIGVQAQQITYSVDKERLGVISGYTGESMIFYAACRSETDRIICVDMYYPADRQGDYGPVVERIALSFIKGGRS